MGILENILSQQMIQKLGWTLIHFLWQAILVALVLAILLRELRKSNANLRYMIICMSLALIVLMPVATIQLVRVSAPDTATIHLSSVASDTSYTGAKSVMEIPVGEPAGHPGDVGAPGTSLTDRVTGALEPALPYIVLGWFVGIFGLSIWHLGGWRQLQRLKRRSLKPVKPSLQNKLGELARILGIRRVVQLVESALVQVPTVVGCLKPVILLPASALSGLSAEQLEAIITHELAHIRRHDYLVNMLQTVVEVLGFYHPAVWWISHKMRAERENCCDDLAVRVSGDKICYARALTSMEEVRAAQPGLAIAVSGGSLFDRICRIAGGDQAHKKLSGWLPSIIAIMLLMALVIPTAPALNTKSNQKSEIKEGYRVRNFVRVVVDETNQKVTFQGEELDYHKLPDNIGPVFTAVENRANTVLELAFAPGTMPDDANRHMALLLERLGIGGQEKKYGFEYISFIGEQPLGSKGSASQVFFTGRYKSRGEIPVGLKSVDGLLSCNSIRFERIGRNEIKALLQLRVTSYPKTKWELRVRLLDAESKEIKAAYKIFENSGVIAGVAYIDKQSIQLSLGKVDYIDKIKSFEIRIMQLPLDYSATNLPKELKWGDPVDGLQCRLRADKLMWEEGEVPTLKIDLLSEQARILPAGPAQDEFELFFDGQWYQYIGPDLMSLIDPSPVKRREGIHLALFPRTWQRKSDGSILNLRRGKHVVQVAFIVSPAVTEDTKPLRVISNPVKIELVAYKGESFANDEDFETESEHMTVKIAQACARQARRIHVAMYQYAKDHDDMYPNKPSLLKPYLAGDADGPSLLICPAVDVKLSQPDEWADIDLKSSYIFASNKTTRDWQEVVMWEKNYNHGAVKTFLYGDGHIELRKDKGPQPEDRSDTILLEGELPFHPLVKAALETYNHFVRAVNAGEEKSSPTIPNKYWDKEPTIPNKYWDKEMKALDPVRIYTHMVNVVVVQRESDTLEEGKYIYLPISSYLPQSGDDGFTFTPNPLENEKYHLGPGIFDYRREK